jgi:hypothetical protein
MARPRCKTAPAHRATIILPATREDVVAAFKDIGQKASDEITRMTQ